MEYTFTFGNETLTFNNLEDHDAFTALYESLLVAQLPSIFATSKTSAIADGITFTSNI